MKFTKTGMALLTFAVLLMTLSLAFAVPSGAITPEADRRYQDEAPSAWDGEDEDFVDGAAIGARLHGMPMLASAAMSDILPVNDIAALEVALVGYQYSEIEPLYQTLKTDFTTLQSDMAAQTQQNNGG